MPTILFLMNPHQKQLHASSSFLEEQNVDIFCDMFEVDITDDI